MAANSWSASWACANAKCNCEHNWGYRTHCRWCGNAWKSTGKAKGANRDHDEGKGYGGKGGRGHQLQLQIQASTNETEEQEETPLTINDHKAVIKNLEKIFEKQPHPATEAAIQSAKKLLAGAEAHRDATKPVSAQLRAVEQGVKELEKQIQDKKDQNEKLAKQIEEANKQHAANTTAIEELGTQLAGKQAKMPKLCMTKQSDNLDIQSLVGSLGKWTEQLGNDYPALGTELQEL